MVNKPIAMRYIFLSLLVSIAFLSNAQCKVTGKVYDDDGQVLPFANIVFDGVPISGVMSNEQGRFVLDVPCDSLCTITASSLGYHASSVEVDPNSSSDKDVNILLEPQIQEIRIHGYAGCCQPRVAYVADTKATRKWKREERRARRQAKR